MSIRKIFVLLFSAFFLSGTGMAATVKVKGIPSCEQWTKERAEQQFRASGMWLIGWLSGWAAATGKNFWEGENSSVLESETVFQWMDAYCQANSLEDVADGGVKLFVERVKAMPGSKPAAGVPKIPAPVQVPQAQAPAPASTGPTLAMVVFSKEPGFISTTRSKLGLCLEDRKIFTLADPGSVDKALANGKYDLDRVYGLDEAEYRAIAAAVGAKYVLFGNLALVKALKFTGWRKDIYSMFYLHKGDTGAKVDSWRSDTILDFTDAATELDADRMLTMVVDRACGKIAQEFRP